MSKSNKSAAASIDNVSDISPVSVKPAFTYDPTTEFLTVDNLPADWETSQDFLNAAAQAKNSNKGCKGFIVGAMHMSPVFRQGTFIVRQARGFGDSAGHTVARKAQGRSPVDALLNDRASMVTALQSEHERLAARLTEVDSLLTALSAK